MEKFTKVNKEREVFGDGQISTHLVLMVFSQFIHMSKMELCNVLSATVHGCTLSIEEEKAGRCGIVLSLATL